MMTVKERFLGVDFGFRRIGTALSDPLGIVAQRHETIVWNGRDTVRVAETLREMCERYDVRGIVIGHPLRTDGRHSELTLAAESFARELETTTGLPVDLFDERFTSSMARRYMRASESPTRRRKGETDRVAAEIILQDYLESRRRRG